MLWPTLDACRGDNNIADNFGRAMDNVSQLIEQWPPTLTSQYVRLHVFTGLSNTKTVCRCGIRSKVLFVSWCAIGQIQASIALCNTPSPSSPSSKSMYVHGHGQCIAYVVLDNPPRSVCPLLDHCQHVHPQRVTCPKRSTLPDMPGA